MKLTNIKITFGSISLSKARNIQIVYKGFDIQVDELALKSNFLNSEISNPLQIFIRDVRINKKVEFIDENSTRDVKKSPKIKEPIKQIPSLIVTLVQVFNR
jgi:hypothetical protein